MELLKHEQAVMKQKQEVMRQVTGDMKMFKVLYKHYILWNFLDLPQALPYCSQQPPDTDVEMNLTSLSGKFNSKS